MKTNTMRTKNEKDCIQIPVCSKSPDVSSDLEGQPDRCGLYPPVAMAESVAMAGPGKGRSWRLRRRSSRRVRDSLQHWPCTEINALDRRGREGRIVLWETDASKAKACKIMCAALAL